MLTEERNRLLGQTSAGTPMGDLLRRYWMPIAGVSELEKNPIKAVRLMGEDLVLYRDLGGKYGLVDRHCPHRRADLSYGFVEECGLRCNYHGWLFDNDGRTLEQPFEDVANPDAHYRDKVRVKAYPIEAKAGLLWAYLGPQPAPLVGERLRADRHFRSSVQLVPGPRELDRSGALRVDAPELEHPAARRDRAVRAAPSQDRVR
jgi:5,5'-dehydrodivanillate O-demethylase